MMACPKVYLVQKTKPSAFKSQSSPWRKRCPPNCRVHKGSRPLCSLLPMKLGGLVPPLQAGAWSFQSRSSTLWLASCCRERIRGSCQLPAKTHGSLMIQEKARALKARAEQGFLWYLLNSARLFVSFQNIISLLVSIRTECLFVCVCQSVKMCVSVW